MTHRVEIFAEGVNKTFGRKSRNNPRQALAERPCTGECRIKSVADFDDYQSLASQIFKKADYLSSLTRPVVAYTNEDRMQFSIRVSRPHDDAYQNTGLL